MFRGRQINCMFPASNLLTTLHVLVPTRALLRRGKPPTLLVASSYQSLPGSLRLLIDSLSWVWQHDQCRNGGRETLIQTKSPLWFSTLKWLYTTHTPWSNYSRSSSSAVSMLNLSEFYLGHVLPSESSPSPLWLPVPYSGHELHVSHLRSVKPRWRFQSTLLLCLHACERETCVKYYLPYQVTKKK